MQIGFIVSPGRGRIDPLIAAVADRLQAEGLRLTGVVQTNTDRPGSHRCDMDVRILPHGPVVRISQNLGRQEMEGRGFRPAIAEALGRGVPVLTGINDDNRAAFDAFVAGMAEALPPDFDAILDWVAAVRAAVAAA
ncbi:MAG: 3-dehydroquinate dehydratase [Alphaproteobacteria bacterium HGW-Alphaproteobacteria-2]|nr:MAG: 3-dehydroquinate dehydratase [Alphaproteobacteria bacterium HGW-Alphaproteobacteria-2]